MCRVYASSSIETILIERPKGLVVWEDRGFMTMFWVTGEEMAMVPFDHILKLIPNGPTAVSVLS